MLKKILKNKFFGNIASLGVVNIANYLFPIITIPIVARALGPNKIGMINYMSSFVSYFSLLVAYSFNVTGTRSVAKDPTNDEWVNKVFSCVFNAQVLLFLLSTITFACSIHVYKPILKQDTLAWYSYLSCVGALFSQYWLFQAKQDLKFVALLNFIPRIIVTIFVVFCVRKESDYLRYAFIINGIALMIAITSFVWSIKRYHLRLYRVGFAEIWYTLWTNRVLFFSSVITAIYSTTGVMILGYCLPMNEVAYYTSAQKLIDILRSVIMMPISQALFPITVKAFNESHDKGIALLKKYLPLFIIFTLVMFIVVEIMGPTVIKILYGEKFKESIPIFLILNIGLFFVYYGYMFGVNAMLTMGMDKAFVRIQIVVAIISLVLTVILVPKLGAVGTSIIWTLSEAIVSCSQFYYLRKKNYKLIDLNVLNINYYKTAIKDLRANLKNR